ncbi:MAG: hypothetical protein QOJ12_837 [Thermoleophilales bacterium]|nr:hypothetical protein [Thermoleophilales bacterium]
MAAAIRACLLALIFVFAAAGTANANTFVVTTTADTLDSGLDGVCSSAQGCSLRAAVQEANNINGRDRIELPPGRYVLTRSGTSPEDFAAEGDLDIGEGVEIVGAGARSTVIDGNATDRVFQMRTSAAFITISGLTITNGRHLSGDSQNGAGVLNQAVETNLADVAIVGNVNPDGPGGGIQNALATVFVPSQRGLRLTRVLIQGNSARFGGGLQNNGTAVIENTTFSGNVATQPTGSQGGGAIEHGGSQSGLAVSFSTFAGNQAPADFGSSINTLTGPAPQLRSVIFADNSNGSCNANMQSHGSNIYRDDTCGPPQPTDQINTDPQIGPLADNGGPTDTHAPSATSPAIDTAAAPCPATDQRSLGRPIGAGCDVGAVELQPAPPPLIPSTLVLDPTAIERRPGDANTVTATVRNGDASPAANAVVRYEIAGPNEGFGTATTDASGHAAISWRGVHTGTDTLSAYVDINGNAVPDHEPSASATVTWSLPAPTQGRSFNLEPLSGKVIIRLPAGTAKRDTTHAAASNAITLSEARQVPIGTTVDVRKGHVEMAMAASTTGNSVQKGEFWGGVYQTVQPRTGARVVTDLRLTESLKCQSSTRGRVTAARATTRKLWGRGKGRFRTRGRHSAATVRGTTWLQKDTCTKTTTVVRQGVVTVTDFTKRKDVKVKAGHRYVARAPRR